MFAKGRQKGARQGDNQGGRKAPVCGERPQKDVFTSQMFSLHGRTSVGATLSQDQDSPRLTVVANVQSPISRDSRLHSLRFHPWPAPGRHAALRATLRRQAADRAHAALVVDAEVQRERGQHHHRREVQEDDVGVRGDLQDGGARGSIPRVKQLLQPCP